MTVLTLKYGTFARFVRKSMKNVDEALPEPSETSARYTAFIACKASRYLGSIGDEDQLVHNRKQYAWIMTGIFTTLLAIIGSLITIIATRPPVH